MPRTEVPTRDPDRVLEWNIARMIFGDYSWFVEMSDDERLAWIIGEDVAECVEVQKREWGNIIIVWDARNVVEARNGNT